MVNYTQEPEKDGAYQRVIWQIRTLYAAIQNNPLSKLNDARIDMINRLKKKIIP